MFPGAFIPLHHLLCIHNAAIPAEGCCRAEHLLLPVPHFGPHDILQALRQRDQLPCQPGKNRLIIQVIPILSVSVMLIILWRMCDECDFIVCGKMARRFLKIDHQNNMALSDSDSYLQI